MSFANTNKGIVVWKVLREYSDKTTEFITQYNSKEEFEDYLEHERQADEWTVNKFYKTILTTTATLIHGNKKLHPPIINIYGSILKFIYTAVLKKNGTILRFRTSEAGPSRFEPIFTVVCDMVLRFGLTGELPFEEKDFDLFLRFPCLWGNGFEGHKNQYCFVVRVYNPAGAN